MKKTVGRSWIPLLVGPLVIGVLLNRERTPSRHRLSRPFPGHRETGAALPTSEPEMQIPVPPSSDAEETEAARVLSLPDSELARLLENGELNGIVSRIVMDLSAREQEGQEPVEVMAFVNAMNRRLHGLAASDRGWEKP